MKKYIGIALAVLMVLGLSGMAMALTDTASQDVTITFSEIAELAVSGDPGTLTIVAPAAAGDLPADVSEATTNMSWTSNVAAASERKITGSLDALFLGIDLHATVVAPGGDDGISAGEAQFAVAATDYDVVTGIKNCNVSAQTITYRAEVTAMVAPYSGTFQTVTWTLTAAA